MKRIIAGLLGVLMLLGTAGCGKPLPNRYEAQFLTAFDTVTTIIAYTDDKQEFTRQSQFIHDQLMEYHQLYDIYNDYEGINNLKTINDHAGIEPVEVDRRIIDLLLLGKQMYDTTNGKVNIAFGSVLSIWHTYRTEGIADPQSAALPPMESLLLASLHTDMEQVVIDEQASTVYLADEQMRLDVGALAKGYAVEQVAVMAEKQGFTSGLISVGGNVRAVGTKDGKKIKWNVGIQNPSKESDQPLIATAYLKDESLVSSGDYQRYYMVDGKAYHHIIDPATLIPADRFKAVSIICKDSGLADGWSTALFNMTLDEGKALINQLDDTEAMWVMPDGSLVTTGGFDRYLKE